MYIYIYLFTHALNIYIYTYYLMNIQITRSASHRQKPKRTWTKPHLPSPCWIVCCRWSKPSSSSTAACPTPRPASRRRQAQRARRRPSATKRPGDRGPQRHDMRGLVGEKTMNKSRGSTSRGFNVNWVSFSLVSTSGDSGIQAVF